MSLILDGTNGLSDVDGSASTPAIRGTDTNTGIFFPAADTIAFAEGGTEVMRIDSDGDVGIGTTNPRSKFTVAGTLRRNVVTNGTNASPSEEAGLIYEDAGVSTERTGIYFSNAFQSAGNTEIRFKTISNDSLAERMRIDATGNLLVGTTSATDVGAGTPRFSIQHTGSTKWGVGPTSSFGNFYIKNATSTGVVLTTNATSWAADSDERKKAPLIPFENAAEKVCSLRAGTGRYLTDEETVSRSFLIAQDVQAVLPEAVDVGEDEDKSLVLRYTDIIPLLVAAIQEQQAIITDLKSRIEALEAK
jgi:hypothetical protein